jgi:glutamate/tyrosine decarboxylase-like PLP-dependent enzyme
VKELLEDVLARAARYADARFERKVGPLEVRQLDEFRHALPNTGRQPAEIIDMLDRLGAPATCSVTGPRYFGFVTGGTLPAALAANWLSSAWDQNAAMYIMSPVGAVLEEISIQWLVDALGLPAGTNGTFTTGATMANFTCMAAARHRVLANLGWDVEKDGLFEAPPITVIVGEEAHVSLSKTLGLLGLGRDRVIRVPVDGQGRMRSNCLPKLHGPAILCLQAGNVNTGAFDPAHEIIPKMHGAWVHVDGAFGLWDMAAKREQSSGYELADSWATDGHKWLNVTYDCGISFVKDAPALKSAMSISAAYLTESPQREGSHWSPESSRKARGIEVWAALLSLGRDGLRELIERCCSHARTFADLLQKAGFEILNDVVLNQVLVSFGSDEKTLAVIQAIQQDGTCWCGGTVWKGRTAMRISVSSWLTTEADVHRSADAMIRIANGI